jgi:multisubunit Na+/H+ antiporter MnhG subunit
MDIQMEVGLHVGVAGQVNVRRDWSLKPIAVMIVVTVIMPVMSMMMHGCWTRCIRTAPTM